MSMSKRNTVLTIGYQGRTLDELLAVLLAEGVQQLIDVRELPLSRRKGFSKTPLREALAGNGIGYVHIRSAGNPFRGEADEANTVLGSYRRHLAEAPKVVDEVERVAREHPSVLLCVELNHTECHRSVIADALVERGLVVRHL
jgi:uncharacterized protein (DUF488 family)